MYPSFTISPSWTMMSSNHPPLPIKERKFFSIAHHLTADALYEAFEILRKDASAGVDGVTYAGYGA